MASKQPLRGVLMLTAAMAVASGLPARADTLADALVKAYQTSPQLDAGRAALRGIDENVPQARASRRPQLDGAIGGPALNLDIKKAEMATRDLITLVKHSELKSRELLGQSLYAFVLDAKKAGKGLAKLTARINGAVDK